VRHTRRRERLQNCRYLAADERRRFGPDIWTSRRTPPLVSKSLVSVHGDHGAAYRYSLLEELRQYAADRLAEDTEAAHTHQERHAEYFLGLRYAIASEASTARSWELERDNCTVAAAQA
jgi:hypothetical protein